MSNNLEVLSKLGKNPKALYNEACRLLIKIAENILKDPSNLKLRTLQKSNVTISKKILGVYGGLDCLIQMGFQENATSYKLPINVPLNKLTLVKDELSKYKDVSIPNSVSSSLENEINKGAIRKQSTEQIQKETPKVEKMEEVIKRVVLPPFKSNFTNPFLREVSFRFHVAQLHDNKMLQERAKKLIPLQELEYSAQKRLKMFQEAIKKNKEDLEISLQDMLILELLSWFKYKFFSWVDNPPCEQCGCETKFSHMCTDHSMLVYTERIEMHKCDDCNSLTPFPRYNDLNILMETRRGRCGEWANTFTLFCRAMGWDARHVFDETDHVWTEVYSFAQKRWLHCDSCENACDTPLNYESGWNKEVSYVTAYSGEEVQDVTWRYSSNHKLVMQRRNKCTEDELISALILLRDERQKNLSESRRNYLAKRLLEELLELMVERKPNDKDQQGRSSGSVAWRMDRGELQSDSGRQAHVWSFSNEETKDFVSIRYSAALDKYECGLGSSGQCKIRTGWNNGVFESSNVFRKVENDWKVSYLARRENVAPGHVTWKFVIQSADMTFDSLHLYFDYTTFENGMLDVTVSNEYSKVVAFCHDTKSLKTLDLSGSKTIIVTAYLDGGKGNVAWQHAQLFRQSLNSDEYPFSIVFTFKKCL